MQLPKGLSRAMIVEPQEVTRLILERQLAILGVESVSCESGAEALAQIGPGIDLVVTDHNMPRMDGIELAEALRKDTIIGHVIDACPPYVRPPEGVVEEIQASG